MVTTHADKKTEFRGKGRTGRKVACAFKLTLC